MDNWITVYPSATSILKIFHSTRNSRIGLVKVNEDWSVIKITEGSVKKIHTYRLTEERIQKYAYLRSRVYYRYYPSLG